MTERIDTVSVHDTFEPGDPEAARSAAGAATGDKYDRLLQLAAGFDAAGEDMRARAQLGETVLRDDDVAASEELSPRTYAQLEEDVRHATTGKHGLLARSVELDADALMIRATVLTYRWIDDLQEAAYKTLGAIAGRAIGYLAPEVELGGAIVSAGLIETDALDRDGVAAYIDELAKNNPDLLEHVQSGGGGLLESLQMRSLLTAGVLAGASGGDAGRGGLRAVGAEPLAADAAAALRDVAGDFTVAPVSVTPALPTDTVAPPRNVEALMSALSGAERGITVSKVGVDRYIAYLPGPIEAGEGRLRLVGGDHSSYTSQVVAAVERAVANGGEGVARVMLVGSAQGGVSAAEVAATVRSEAFVVEQVVTAGAPGSQVHDIPESTRVLSLEDRADPVALLGSLINAKVANRLTVVFDAAADGAEPGRMSYVAGGRAADQAGHPELRAEISRLQELGYLAG
ncbi:hypothetical protein [Nocardioides bigeumensis]|uniref:Uncharacterized protein n=1 Tax=Nocardioides bigeumensis TaxID=433657 RepID=A0ABP5KKT3_9ACTN